MSETTEALEPQSAPEPESPARRRTAIIVAVSVAVVAILGAGSYAAVKLLGHGPDVAESLPATTVGFVSVDLNPSAGQKIEAIRTLRKFPELKKRTNLDTTDDLRRYLFDESTKKGGCTSLDYDKDVKSWLGESAAFGGAALGAKNPSPFVALQYDNRSAATKGLDRIIACSKSEQGTAYAFGDTFVIVSDSADHARAIVAGAKKHPLSADADYQKWSHAAGDPGVVSFYVARKAADTLLQLGSQYGADAARAKELIGSFEGMAGTVRFADGGMEMELAAGGLDKATGTTRGGPDVARLPGDTAVALGFGVPGDFAARVVDSVKAQLGSTATRGIAEIESQTGLKLPEDLQTLLGSAVTLSLGGAAPLDLTDVKEPADVPFGVDVHGDPDKIKAVFDKISERTGKSLDELDLNLQSSSDHVAFATSASYSRALVSGGRLGANASFARVVPHASQALGVFYVDFNSAWRDSLLGLAEKEAPQEARKLDLNTRPLGALGISSWREGSVTHGLLKLTTD